VAVHAVRREPRAHWLLLALAMTVLFGALCLNGYVSHVGSEGGASPQAAGLGAPAPRAVTDGGPVVRVDATGAVTTRRMPARTVALTFDDGPDPKWTPQVLDVLRRHHAHATFFVVGSRADRYPDLVRRILAEGHEIGSHSFTHADLSAVPGWQRSLELGLTGNALAGVTGRQVTLVRPPFSARPAAASATDFAAMRDIGAAGYLTVLTDLDTRDWSRPGADEIVRAGTPARGSGAVVMMHDSGGDRSQTVAALDRLLGDLDRQGYRFTTVSQGLGLPGEAPAPAATRLRGQALRIAQALGAGLNGTMAVLLVVALVLGVGRLPVQVWCARAHLRRDRRHRGEGLRYLGPVSVIVPAYNESANIANTVRSLLASDYPQLEVIVVDDGSTDGTAEIVRRLRLPGVRVIRQENAGKPAALNNGIAHARGDLLVLVDGDTVFEAEALGRLVQPFRDPSVGAVAGNTKVANRRGLLGRWQHLEYVTGFNLDRRMFDMFQCITTVPGAIGGFRREALADVGGVSSATLAEDTDLTMGILRSGWRVVYTEHAVAWTEAPSSLRQLWRQRYRWCFGTMQAMYKHRRTVFQGGSAGRLGRRGLLYTLLFQVLLPLTAPAVDAYGLYGLLFLPLTTVAAVWCGFVLLQALTCAYALRMDGESLGPLWSLPLQQVVYRQLMYLVVVQSTVMAVLGGRLRWHRMVRTGEAAIGAARG
jgi:cellulose synthase/poly-beta-1,6-N-acetylglucosamine synthase-like glycosyltransferase/peptidoglycan/xylan/chitin deacetylase (PgdA/CDA1 family)